MHTHVTFVLDASGSMEKIEEETVDAFNSFIDEQTDETGTATVSLYTFNSQVDRIHRVRDIENMPELTGDDYMPVSRTALNDAIKKAITDTAKLVTGDDDEQVVVVILTDGHENASHTSEEKVAEMIEMKRNVGWEFLFIAANQDAVLQAEEYGISPDNALNMDHDGAGARAAVQAASGSITRARKHGETQGFLPADRRQQDSDPRA